MSTGLYDVQAIAEKLRLSETHTPTEAEAKRVYDENFKTSPGEKKDPDPQKTSSTDLKRRSDLVAADAKRFAKGSIFFRKSNQGIVAPVGAINFDLVLEDEINLRAVVCQHPVQSGEPVTDHIQPLPPTGRLKILVSNYSIKYGPGGQFEGQWSRSKNRAIQAYDTFKQIFQSRQTVNMVTILETFNSNDVVLTDVTVAKTSATGDALEFEIGYTKITTVTLPSPTKLQVVAKPAGVKTPKDRQASSLTSSGTVSPEDTGYTPGGYP